MRDIPTERADEFDQLIAEQAAVLTTAQAKAFFTPGVIQHRLIQRRWRRLCHGVLLIGSGRLMRDQQLWAAVLAAGKGARLAGQAAAIEGGVKGLQSEPIDVLMPTERRWAVPRRRLPPELPVRIHRTAILPPRHQRTGRPPRTTVARAVIDGAAWAQSDEEARSLITRACEQRRVTCTALRDVLELFPSVRRHHVMIATIADVEGDTGRRR